MIRLMLFVMLLGAVAPHARAGECGSPVVVAQKVDVNGRTVRYDAETGRVPIRDSQSDEVRGCMFYVAYRVASKKPRPLAFIWNGGPGANASLLHFKAFGPKTIEDGALKTNPQTLLTAADLVFVDPIGTGFSRPAKADFAPEFYGTLGDIASVTEFVRAWRVLHDAGEAPLYLIGESWGAGRAGAVGYQLEKRRIRVRGLVLISGGSGLADPEDGTLRQALRVANMAAVALYYGKLPAALGKDWPAIESAAETWAREVYAPALARAASLTDAERDEIAEGLARFTGLDKSDIDRKSLVVTPRLFRTRLLKAEGKTLNVFDMRLAGDEPLLPEGVIENYLRRDLGFTTDLVYLSDANGFDRGYAPGGAPPPSVNARWDYFTTPMSDAEKRAAIEEAVRTGSGPPKSGSPPPSAGEAVGLDPRLRVLVASGLYDSFANCAGDRQTQSALQGALRKAYSFRCYAGGHMMYLDTGAHAQLVGDIKSLISETMRE